MLRDLKVTLSARKYCCSLENYFLITYHSVSQKQTIKTEPLWYKIFISLWAFMLYKLLPQMCWVLYLATGLHIQYIPLSSWGWVDGEKWALLPERDMYNWYKIEMGPGTRGRPDDLLPPDHCLPCSAHHQCQCHHANSGSNLAATTPPPSGKGVGGLVSLLSHRVTGWAGRWGCGSQATTVIGTVTMTPAMHAAW